MKNLRLPLIAAALSALAFTVLILLDYFFGLVVYRYLFVPVATVTLLVRAAVKRGRRLSNFFAALAVCAISWPLVTHPYAVRSTARWLFLSHSYKLRMMAQPKTSNGSLQHVEWDGWGFAGVGDTNVYLVFDPINSLEPAAHNDAPGKYPGIPCEVASVHQLEPNWYAVTYYAETDWNHCSIDP